MRSSHNFRPERCCETKQFDSHFAVRVRENRCVALDRGSVDRNVGCDRGLRQFLNSHRAFLIGLLQPEEEQSFDRQALCRRQQSPTERRISCRIVSLARRGCSTPSSARLPTHKHRPIALGRAPRLPKNLLLSEVLRWPREASTLFMGERRTSGLQGGGIRVQHLFDMPSALRRTCVHGKE